MSNSYFQFKQFIIHQDKCAMKVTTDACLFGAWVAQEIRKVRKDSPKESLRTFGEKLIINNCLDIGTGTGLLALMFAQKNPEIFIDAIEIDADAATQAKENVQASPWKDRVQVSCKDVRNLNSEKKYDLILCNPPFYENELKAESNKKNIAHHSEELLMEELLAIIKKKLRPTGIFCLLLPYKRNEEVKRLLTKNGFEMLQMTFVKQSSGHDYFRTILTGRFKKAKLTEPELNEISIWNEKQEYTTEFITLLKDYYLHL